MQSYLIVFAKVILLPSASLRKCQLPYLSHLLAFLILGSFASSVWSKSLCFPYFINPFYLTRHITLLLMIFLIFPFNYAFIIRSSIFQCTFAISYLIVQFIYLFPFISLWILFLIYLVFPCFYVLLLNIQCSFMQLLFNESICLIFIFRFLELRLTVILCFISHVTYFRFIR